MKLSINKTTIAVALTCLLSTSTFAAQQTTEKEKTNEVIGLSSGALLGTALGGPLGGIIGAVFGVMVADDVNTDKKLELVSNKLEAKDQQLVAMQQQFDQAKQRSMIQLASLDQALEQNVPEIESNIQFKTASYVLEEHYKSQLDLIADTLRKNPKLNVTLSGFADKRGDSSYNQALSEQRALTVKNYLVSQNVNSKQVITHSFGESELVSTGANFEDDFFDRRVMLKVSDNQAEMTASN